MGTFLKIVTLNRFFAITLAPFGIFIKDKEPCRHPITLRHEITHWRQQLEMGIIFFYLWYLLEWIIKLLKYGKHAYHEISFEREAYFSQIISNYNKHRKHYIWLKLLCHDASKIRLKVNGKGREKL